MELVKKGLYTMPNTRRGFLKRAPAVRWPGGMAAAPASSFFARDLRRTRMTVSLPRATGLRKLTDRFELRDPKQYFPMRDFSSARLIEGGIWQLRRRPRIRGRAHHSARLKSVYE